MTAESPPSIQRTSRALRRPRLLPLFGLLSAVCWAVPALPGALDAEGALLVPAAAGSPVHEQLEDSPRPAGGQELLDQAAGLRAEIEAWAGPGLPPQDLQVRAFNCAAALIAAGQYRVARSLQEPLHQKVRADWSALDLTLTLERLGERGSGERVLAEQLQLSSEPAELWNQLGLLALAGGAETAAIARFGRAVRLGSENAGLSLARLHWTRGRSAEARTLFRAGVDLDSPPAWSLAGWGLCLLDP